MSTNRPLTASLHTVTAVSRVALYLSRERTRAGYPKQANEAEILTADALAILGYQNEADAAAIGELSELLAKCVAATAKALA